MAVVNRGSVVWTRTLGVLNVKTNEAVVENSLFEAASASKPVFAYGVLRLADERQIDLDRPLAFYYKPPYLPDDPRIRQITARHVITHSSGLPNWGDEDKPETLTPKFKPGEFFSYSGEGYLWLQLVIERITGQGLDVFMRSRVLEPAGMIHSTFIGDSACERVAAYGHVEGRVAREQGWRDVVKTISPIANRWGKPVRDWAQDDWVRAAGEIVPTSPLPKRVRFENAASSLLTTAKDYARFLTLVMKHRSRASWEISDVMRLAMVSPQIAVQNNVPFWWGLGWAVEQNSNGWRFSHEGNNDGRFTAFAAGDPVRGKGIVVLANAGSGFGVYQRIVRAATGDDLLSFVADLNPPHGI